MSIRCKLQITTMIMLLPLLVPSISSGATVEEGPSNLGLQLEVEKSTFVRLEPVFVTVRLENPVTWDITAEIRSLALEDRYLQLSVQEGDGDAERYYFGPVVDTVGGSTRSFEPGDTMVETIRGFFNDVTHDLAFVHTGQHKVHGRVYLGNHPQPVYKRATPVEIDVVEPQPEDL